MMLINDVLVDEEIATTHFSCDLEKCKGACCTFPGEYGAPVLDSEVNAISESLEVAKEYLSENSIKYIEKYPEDKATGYKMGDFRGAWKIVFNN